MRALSARTEYQEIGGDEEVEGGLLLNQRLPVAPVARHVASAKWFLLAASVAAVMTVAVFGMSSVDAPLSAAVVESAANVERRRASAFSHDEGKFTGDDLPKHHRDCKCAEECSSIPDPVTGVPMCTVADEQCMGVDYKRTTKIDPDAGCVDVEGNANGNCRAVCDHVEGRYDCWSFPCLNGGYCLDGVDDYTCYCAYGWEGKDCDRDVDECMSMPDEPEVCDEQAVCENYDGGYKCDCSAGWTGDGYSVDEAVPLPPWLKGDGADREVPGCVDLDDCHSHPCHGDAECADCGNRCFECTCGDGWLGELCDVDRDECEDNNNNCARDAKCRNLPGTFDCMCEEGYSGDGKEGADEDSEGMHTGCTDNDDCASNPCQNDGECSDRGDGTGEFDCSCVIGWDGLNCQDDVNECELGYAECHLHAMCMNTPGSYECLCNAGWQGDGVQCEDEDDCAENPCNNGGHCVDCGTLCYMCDCDVGWRGPRCTVDWDECMMGIHTCHDDSTCINTVGSYECECDPGFSGDGSSYCEDVNDCVTWLPGADADDFKDDIQQMDTDNELITPCGSYDEEVDNFEQHGACKDLGSKMFVCDCDAGWTDVNCDMDINECGTDTNYCHAYATCINIPGSYTCECNAGFTGDGVTACQDIDDCGTSPCQHGACADIGADAYSCDCYPGWTDAACDYDIDECATLTHHCHQKAECTNTEGSYKCACKVGFDGDGKDHCDDIDDCGSAPCKHGECIDNGPGFYQCKCDDGWTDTTCDHDVNECYMGIHDCSSDAVCVNTPGKYYCRCKSGWQGDGYTCIDLDDCDPDPCDPQHGTCSDAGQNRYTCACDDGFTSQHCDMDVNECQAGTHACAALAHCYNTFGSHVCECFDDHWGDGQVCFPCTECEEGYDPQGTCETEDRKCVDINECEEMTDDCDDHAQCHNTPGTFECSCKIDEEWTGDGRDCRECTQCTAGYHVTEECTSTRDRECAINVEDGLYLMGTQADDSRQCLVMGSDGRDFYPTRYSWGYGDNLEYCGIGEWNGKSQMENVMESGMAVWRFTHISADLYTIETNSRGDGWRCLAFMGEGAQPYPEPHIWGEEPGRQWCGFYEDGITPRDVMLGNKQAVWRLVPLEDNQFLIQSAARNDGKWECLGFAQQGAATNPSRIDFGNDDPDGGEDLYCGGYGLDDHEDPVQGLIANKQAVWILQRLGADGEENDLTKYMPGNGDDVAKEGGEEIARRISEEKAKVTAHAQATAYKRQLAAAASDGAKRTLRIRQVQDEA